MLMSFVILNKVTQKLYNLYSLWLCIQTGRAQYAVELQLGWRVSSGAVERNNIKVQVS